MKRVMKDVLALAELFRPSWPEISARIERSGVPTAYVSTDGGKLREKIKSLEADIAKARDERVPLQAELDSAIESYAGKEVSEDSAEFESAKTAAGAVGAVDDRIHSLNKQLIDTLQMIGRTPVPRPDEQDSGGWSSNELFSPELVDTLSRASSTRAHLGELRIGEVASRESMAAEGDPSDTEPLDIQRRGAFRGILPQLRQPLNVLDIIRKGTMDLNTFEYGREEGPIPGSAKPVKEGTRKPGGAFEFLPAKATAETIAEFMKMKKQQLADVPALRSTMDGRLRYLLELALEAEVLVGKGESPELEGILPVSGKGVVKFKSGEITADSVLSGITTVLLAFARANAVLMNPLDWESVLKQKAEEGDMQYYGGGPFAITPQALWGVNLIPAFAIPQGRVLVADLNLGAELLFRSGIEVLLSDADGTDFTENRVTMLAELRAACVVWRPSAFAEVFLTKAAEEAAEAE